MKSAPPFVAGIIIKNIVRGIATLTIERFYLTKVRVAEHARIIRRRQPQRSARRPSLAVPPPAHSTEYVSRPWYLRSYSRSPIKLTPAMASLPMRVAYWGRWVDSAGNVELLSAPAVAWIEGGSHRALPGGVGIALGGRKAVPALDVNQLHAPTGRDEKYSVAVLQAKYQALQPQAVDPLPPRMIDGEPVRQLEGPARTKRRESARGDVDHGKVPQLPSSCFISATNSSACTILSVTIAGSKFAMAL
jgi:hypothetical protein